MTRDGCALRTKVDVPYEEAIEPTVAASKEQGFGVMTEIDVKPTFKERLEADFRQYIILGACNPSLANQALSTDLEVGLLLPRAHRVHRTPTRHIKVIVEAPGYSRRMSSAIGTSSPQDPFECLEDIHHVDG